MQGNRGKIKQILVKPCTKISRKSYEGKVTILRNQQERRDRTIPNNKPDITVHYNKKRNMHVNRCCNSWRQKCDQERS